MIALSVPWLLLVLLLTAIFILLKKRWVTGSVLLVIMVVLNLWAECIPFRVYSVKEDCDKCIKLLTFNIDGASDDFGNRVIGIADLIQSINPDVVFLAEYGEEDNHGLDSLLKDNYPFTTLTKYGAHYFFSKYPLNQQYQLLGVNNDDTGTYITRMNAGSVTLFLFGCHFASNNYTDDRQYLTPDSIKGKSDLALYIKNISRAYDRRSYEADIQIGEIKKTKGPIIVMGDFNDVCGSECIRKLEKLGFKDSWWEKGVGYGATIHWPLPYRIDHILHTKELKLKSIKVIDSKGLSDHNALYAEFEYL